MDAGQHSFSIANQSYFKAIHDRWHRQQSKRQILRSQVGFPIQTMGRPVACQGCSHYHGISYGMTNAKRTPLICGMHPFGWYETTPCPDWEEDENSLRNL